MLTENGPVKIETPRDRNSHFEPELMRKGQRRLAAWMRRSPRCYVGGMTTREIETYMADMNGAGVSRETSAE